MKNLDAGELERFEKEAIKLIARAWSDSVFYQRFTRDPMVILRDAGILVAGLSIVFVHTGQSATAMISKQETTKTGKVTYEICLPPKPEELLDEQVNTKATPPIRPSCC